MTSVIKQARFQEDRTEHTVTTHTPGTVSVCHSNYDGYINATVHLTVDGAAKLRDMLSEAIALLEPEPVPESNLHPVMAEALGPFVSAQ